MTNRDDYLHIRDEVHKEHVLLNQRVLWLVTSQSFLFVPLAIGIDKASGTKMSDSLFFPLIPQLGILICIVALIGIIAAIFRINDWKHEQYKILQDKNKNEFIFQNINLYECELISKWLLPLFGFVPAIFIPIFIV